MLNRIILAERAELSLYSAGKYNVHQRKSRFKHLPSGLDLDNEHILQSWTVLGENFFHAHHFQVPLQNFTCKQERKTESLSRIHLFYLGHITCSQNLEGRVSSHAAQTADRQTADRRSDPPKWHFLVYYDQTIVWEQLLYVVARVQPWIRATKGKISPRWVIVLLSWEK